MTPPISIDGTDITGATIDGTDVQEITVDGQTVFTAETLPVAYSNLVAWWPFDSSFYGGSNADDVTALFNPGQSGDSTAYDGSVSGANYQSSGGVTDINAGANSGAFEFDGSNDEINVNDSVLKSHDMTVCFWAKDDGSTSTQTVVSNMNFNEDGTFTIERRNGSTVDTFHGVGGNSRWVNANANLSNLTHIAFVSTSNAAGDKNFFVNGNSVTTTVVFNNTSFSAGISNNLKIGAGNGISRFCDGIIEDVRIYDTALSNAQIDQIYQNTKP